MSSSSSKSGAGYQVALTSLLSLNFGFVLFDRNAAGFLMPFIQPELGLSGFQVGLLSSGLSLTWAIAAFGIGVVSDRTGSRKGLLVLATLAFSLCSFGSGLAAGFVILLLTRMLMGFAEGGIMPISQALLVANVSEKNRGLAMGVSQGFGSSLLGSFVAPIVLVSFGEAFGWRTAFFLAAIPGLIIALLMALVIRKPATETEQKTAAPQPDSEPAPAPAAVTFASYREALQVRNIKLCSLMSILLVSYLVVTWSFMPLFLNQTRGFEEITTGWLMSTLGISATIASFVVPWLSDRIGRCAPMIALPVLAIIVPLSAIYFEGPTWMLGGIFMLGWLVTGTMPLFMSAVPAESVDRRLIAGALGVCMGAGELIGGVFSAAIAGIAADWISPRAPLWIMTGLALAASVVAIGIQETAPRVLARRQQLEN